MRDEVWRALMLALAICAGVGAGQETPPPAPPPVELEADRKPALVTNGDCLIRGATLLPVSRPPIAGASILVRNGKISAIGTDLIAPAGVVVIEAAGKFVTPGIIDAHSHIAANATNEGTDSITAEVRIHDVLNPQSVSIYRALGGGVTSALILHGSANTIGGQSVVVKLKYRRTPEEMIVPDAPRMIKFALGENVTRSKSQNVGQRFPSSRMGVEATLRRAFDDARRYQQTWARYESARSSESVPPRRDLRLEALAGVLKGDIWVHCHGYRADEMLMLLRLSKEYGFKIAAFQHALEAYKIAPEISAQGVGVSTFSDWWAYKIEAWDAIPYNAALCAEAGILTSINSDDAEQMRRLNQEAAKSIKHGAMSDAEALKLVTLNPARQLGISHRAGTLEVGKDADLAIWEGHPLSTFSRCAMTLVEGEVLFQRRNAFGLEGPTVIRREPGACRTDHLALAVPTPARSIALVGGTVHPVSGPEIARGTVVIHDGKIQAAGASVAVPRDAVTVNAQGLHVYPGLIDGGTDLGLSELDSARETIDAGDSGAFQPDLLSLTAVNAASEHIPVARFRGVTTALTRPAGGTISGRSAVINLDGWTPDQMAVRSPAALHVNWPQAPSAGLSRRFSLTPEQVRQREAASRTALERLREFFDRAKAYAAARTGAGETLVRDARLEAMVPYVEGRLPVVFDADSARSIRAAVKLAGDFGLKAVISGGREAWKVAALLADKKVPVIYSSVFSTPYAEHDPYDTGMSAPALLHRAGVRFCFRSRPAGAFPPSPAPVGFQAGTACAYGLPHDAALKALTLDAAEILGVADRVGSLEAGKLANVIVTDGDPMDVTTSLHYLFIAGKPVALETKHTRLYQKYRARLTRKAP